MAMYFTQSLYLSESLENVNINITEKMVESAPELMSLLVDHFNMDELYPEEFVDKFKRLESSTEKMNLIHDEAPMLLKIDLKTLCSIILDDIPDEYFPELEDDGISASEARGDLPPFADLEVFLQEAKTPYWTSIDNGLASDFEENTYELFNDELINVTSLRLPELPAFTKLNQVEKEYRAHYLEEQVKNIQNEVDKLKDEIKGDKTVQLTCKVDQLFSSQNSYEIELVVNEYEFNQFTLSKTDDLPIIESKIIEVDKNGCKKRVSSLTGFYPYRGECETIEEDEVVFDINTEKTDRENSTVKINYGLEWTTPDGEETKIEWECSPLTFVVDDNYTCPSLGSDLYDIQISTL